MVVCWIGTMSAKEITHGMRIAADHGRGEPVPHGSGMAGIGGARGVRRRTGRPGSAPVDRARSRAEMIEAAEAGQAGECSLHPGRRQCATLSSSGVLMTRSCRSAHCITCPSTQALRPPVPRRYGAGTASTRPWPAPARPGPGAGLARAPSARPARPGHSAPPSPPQGVRPRRLRTGCPLIASVAIAEDLDPPLTTREASPSTLCSARSRRPGQAASICHAS